MNNEWQYQLRINMTKEMAELARQDLDDPVLASLFNVLKKHNAVLKCQYDAFADYVAEAEKNGIANYHLYEWTKDTIENPAKKTKYLQSFTLYINGDEVYPQLSADALEADLQPLLDDKLIIRLSKHDTNPANNPQSPARYRKGDSGDS